LTLPVILDITTNPPNDSVKRTRKPVSFPIGLVNACEPGRALKGRSTETHNQQKMHVETRGERYFSMHRLTGAELTKLIDLKLWIGNAGG